MQIHSKSDVREASIEAVIIRADGRREYLGVISYYHVNPFKRLAYAIKTRVRKWLQSLQTPEKR